MIGVTAWLSADQLRPLCARNRATSSNKRKSRTPVNEEAPFGQKSNAALFVQVVVNSSELQLGDASIKHVQT